MIALICLVGRSHAESPPNGFYKITGTPNEPAAGEHPLRRVDGGQPASIERSLPIKAGRCELQSTTNDNTSFSLRLLDCAPVEHFDPWKTAVVADGLLARIHGHNRNNDATYNFSATIIGPENVAQFAKAFDAKVVRRQHPGHRLTVHWKSVKQEYAVGDDVRLELKIRNVGDKPIRFVDGGYHRGPRNNQFQFIALAGGGFGKPVNDHGDGTSLGGIGVHVTLEPEETFTKEIGLGKWFQFQQADSYQITGTYQLDLLGPNGGIIWNDYVTGRCLVQVVDRKLKTDQGQ